MLQCHVCISYGGKCVCLYHPLQYHAHTPPHAPLNTNKQVRERLQHEFILCLSSFYFNHPTVLENGFSFALGVSLRSWDEQACDRITSVRSNQKKTSAFELASENIVCSFTSHHHAHCVLVLIFAQVWHKKQKERRDF